ncbi:MAG: site-specific integrase [Bdellovibrionota bacterium]
MQLDKNAIDEFKESLKTRGRLPSTIESYARDAQRFIDYLEAEDLNLEDVEAHTMITYQQYLRNICEDRDNSIRRSVIGVRQFFRFLSDVQYIINSPLDHAIIPPRDESLPNGITSEDLDLVFEFAANTAPVIKSTRDCAILALLSFEGLKAGEIIDLKWSYFLKENNLGSLKITGSRGRIIKLSPETTKTITTYHRHYAKVLDSAFLHDKDAKMFIAFKGRDTNTPIAKISRHGLKFMLYELGEKANIKGLNTEMLRHHATNYLLEQGRSIDEIMQHFGLKRAGNIAKHVATFSNTDSALTGRNHAQSER